MDIIEVENVARTFTVRRKVGRLRRERTEVRAVHELSFRVRASS
jgi:ABC-2 type transport system ATP-binding protein